MPRATIAFANRAAQSTKHCDSKWLRVNGLVDTNTPPTVSH